MKMRRLRRRWPAPALAVLCGLLPGQAAAAAQRPLLGETAQPDNDNRNGLEIRPIASKASELLSSLLSLRKAESPEESELIRQDQLDAMVLAQAIGSRQDQVESLLLQEAQTVRAQESALEAVSLKGVNAKGLNNRSALPLMDSEFLSIPLSCYVASPCGKVIVGDDPVSISTPFGSFVLHGRNQTRQDIEQLDAQFRDTVYYAAWIGVAFTLVWFIVRRPAQQKVYEEYRRVIQGELTPPDDIASPEEVEAELEKRKNPTALYFIAPGNVYRLLAIMHPGVVGWKGFYKLAFQGAVCAFMQFYLPFCFARSVLLKWEYAGTKSPLWYTERPADTLCMFMLVGALNLVMGGRIREHVVVGAEANYYILTHHKPNQEELDDMASQQGERGDVCKTCGQTVLAKENSREKDKRKPAADVDEKWIDRNELFWCTASTCLDIVVSLLCQIIFIMEVGTCDINNVEKIVTISIALIFIFEIDDKMMDIDPRNRTRYRREVLRSVVVDQVKPTWIKTIAAIAVWISWAVNLLGVAGYVLIRWRNRETGYELGAAPLSSQ